ncbi:MAG: alpha/beta hydrolase [Clostridia bacterium]|nr:alpha/beta hydrolase [Clostridia bacterium]
MFERVYVPSSRGAKIVMDAYVPRVSREIDPAIRRPAIVVCPGGGYEFCSEREAEPVALRFLAEGFNVFVVWYRVGEAEGDVRRDSDAAGWYQKAPEHVFPLPQHDAAAAIAYVRAHAAQHHTDPDRIAIMGFSAGGHLAASVSGLWHRAEIWQELGLAPEDVRPNAAVLCYPVIVADQDAHRGSFVHLSGTEDVAKHAQYDVTNWVTEHYPPTFLWHTFTDNSVPVQNSLRMGLALANAGVLTEMHIFPRGRHGLSLANAMTCHAQDSSLQQIECTQWPSLAARFLKDL